MSDSLVASIAARIKTICASVQPFDPAQYDLGRSLVIFSDSNAFLISESTRPDYLAVISELLSEYGDRFSQKRVSDDVDEVIARFIASSDEHLLNNDLDELINGYKSFQDEQEVYVPVAGMNLYVDSLKFGNVELLNTSDAIAKIKASRRNAVPDQTQDDSGSEVIRMIEEAWKTNTCSRVKLVAEPERAKELAIEECERVLDIFIYSSASIYHFDWRIPRGLKVQTTEALSSTSAVVVMPDGRVSAGFKTSGPVGYFDVNDRNLESMKKVGAFQVTDILVKAEPTELEEQIVRAIHWFAESQVQDDEGNELLGLITCLEMFLTPEKGSDKSVRQSVAEGTASLIENDPIDRENTRRFILEMYDKRSDVVHGRKLSLKSTDLLVLRAMVIAFTTELINSRGKAAH